MSSDSARGFLAITRRFQNVLALLLLAVGLCGCRAVRTTRVVATQIPSPPQNASLAQLVAKVNSQSAAIQSLTTIVDMKPSTGSVYSGVISRYPDVRGFLLVKRPAFIRMTGQAPVVHTDIFDMASDGEQFSLYIPSRNKFYVGNVSLPQKPGASLENIRPQHILQGFLLEAIDASKESYFLEDVDRGSERDYVIGIVAGSGPGPVSVKREIWFGRSNLEISRVELYGAAGMRLESIEYSEYQDYDGIHYPTRIRIERPVEGYSFVITLEHPRFNQPVANSKFVLEKPAGVEVINLGNPAPGGSVHGQ
ncbi:MAG: hypothetical protein ACRD3D_16505 [Terriglobia bacterium]